LEMTVASQREALSWRTVQVSELETAKLYWERESAARADELQRAETRLREVTDVLTSVQDSLTWKITTRLRKISNRFLGKSGAPDGRTRS
jgi:hypothetical protein